MFAALLLMLATAASAPPAKAPADTGNAMLTKALAELDAGRAREAIDLLKELLDQNSDNYGVWFNLGVAYGMAGDEAAGMAAFRKTLSLEPKLYEAHLNLGQMLLHQKQYSEAVAELTQAAEEQPRAERAQLLLGRALAGANQGAAAVEHFRTATALDATDAQAFLLLGRTLAAQKNWDEACAALERYTVLTPADTTAQLELAGWLEQAGKPLAAAARYARFPKDAAALERAGMLELDASDFKAAAGHLGAALALAPTPALRYALAQAQLRGGDKATAAATMQAMVLEQPANYEARMTLGRLLRDQLQYDPAAVQFSAATKLKPDALEAWNELLGMLLELKNYPAALQTLEKSRQLGGETAAYHWYRAIMLDALRQHKEALASYKRFLQLSDGKTPDEEFLARQRVRILTRMLER